LGENELNKIKYNHFLKKLLQLESDRDNVQKKMDKMNEDLAACKLHIQQLEAKNKALQCAVEVEQKQVRQLEEDKDALNAKVVAMQTTFEQICAELQQQHAKLVAQLRDQMAEKNGQIKKLTVCNTTDFTSILNKGINYRPNFWLPQILNESQKKVNVN
jgi:chromosome segregation ATPase